MICLECFEYSFVYMFTLHLQALDIGSLKIEEPGVKLEETSKQNDQMLP